MPKGVSASNGHCIAEDFLHRSDLRARLGFEQHLPGNIHQHKREARLCIPEFEKGMLGGGLGCTLT